MNSVEAVCIDHKNRPDEIPLDCWPKEGKWYNIVHVYYHKMQGIQGVDLAEIKPPESAYPYETYKLTRFAVTPAGFEKLIALIKDCNDLNDIDLSDLKEELKRELIK